MNTTVEYLWATPLFTGTVQSYSDALAHVLDIKKDHAVVDPSGNWTSPDDLHTRAEFKELCDEILEFVDHNLDSLTVQRDSAYISCMWANTAPVGVAHALHEHANCMYSGVVYLQAPEGSAGTYFRDPRDRAAQLVPGYDRASPQVLGKDCVSSAEAGKIVMWPAWLAHGVLNTRYQPDQLRVSLSFNIMLRGVLGANTTHLDTRTI